MYSCTQEVEDLTVQGFFSFNTYEAVDDLCINAHFGIH